MRRQLQKHEIVRDVEEAVAEMDKAMDAALTEINKMGSLVQKELNDKYNEILFLYNLISDKQKEIHEEGDIVSEMVEQYLQTHKAQLQVLGADVLSKTQNATIINEQPEVINPPVKSRPKFSNPRHEEIWNMRELGNNVATIAKELGMGQGEVKLILDLADRAS